MKSVSPDNVPTCGDAFWSPMEVRIQAAQVRGQLDIWEALARECDGCGAEPDEPCRVGCLGLAL